MADLVLFPAIHLSEGLCEPVRLKDRVIAMTLIAAHLEGLEETIIHRLVDRAQFAANPTAYARGASGFDGAGEQSLFDLRLRYQEEMDAVFGRYHVPEERPFHRDLPESRRSVHLPENPLRIADFNLVNVTARIVNGYKAFLPQLSTPSSAGWIGAT